MKGPLSGVRVLDFGLLTAGANTSAMLADLGADVIKIESAAYLDPFRVVGKMDDDDGWWNRSPQFRFTNRNKRGLALNLKDPEGQRVIRELPNIAMSSWRISAAACSTVRALGYQAEGRQPAHRVRRHLEPERHTASERMNVSFGSTLDPPGIASITGYEARSRASPAWT